MCWLGVYANEKPNVDINIWTGPTIAQSTPMFVGEKVRKLQCTLRNV